MLNVLDLWKSAQAVAALESAGRQIGLTPDQARAAALALTPAFLMALQRNAFQSPASFADLMRLTGAGAFAPLVEGGLSAFTPQRQAQAEDAVARLFGPEVSRLVAAQTAAVAGIAPEAVRRMLPLVTGLMFGNLSSSAAPGALSRMAETASSAPANPPGTVFEQMMRPWMPADEPARAPPPAPNPWEDVFAAMFGLPPRPPAPPPAPAPPPPADPFGDMLRAMMGASEPEPAPPAPPPPEPPPPEPADAWGDAFRAGETAQRRHLEALQAIFDGAWRPQPDPAR